MMDRIKRNLPKPIHSFISWFFHPISHIKRTLQIYKERKIIDESAEHHLQALKRIKNNNPITCVFLALFDSVWKYDNVYRLLQEDPRFNPVILVCPIVNHGYQNMLERMDKCYLALKRKGYNVLKSYNPENKTYIDIRKDLHPDLLFYTNPYKGLIDDRYFITEFPDILTIYVPYHFGNNNDYQTFNNLFFHNLLWRNYVETEDHKKIYQEHEYLKGRNVLATGYPGIEPFLDNTKKGSWKNKGKKKIIWAPHHSIEPVGNVIFSCFLIYADFMVDMAKKYKDEIDIAFKPHPLLKSTLYKMWGKDKTNAYYHQWETMPNTMLQEGEYVDLFLTSDAMIHDSGSFLLEYLYTRKPVMRTMTNVNPKSMYCDFALDALEVYYKAYSEQDIEQFIQNVIHDIDPLKEKRETFYKNRLLPPNGKSPSQNIINDIVNSIKHQRVWTD